MRSSTIMNCGNKPCQMCKEATKDRHFSSDPIDEAVNMFIAGISMPRFIYKNEEDEIQQVNGDNNQDAADNFHSNNNNNQKPPKFEEMEAHEQIHYILNVLEKPLAIAEMDSYKENLERATTLNMMLKAKAREVDDVIESRFVELAKLQEHLSGFQIAAKKEENLAKFIKENSTDDDDDDVKTKKRMLALCKKSEEEEPLKKKKFFGF